MTDIHSATGLKAGVVWHAMRLRVVGRFTLVLEYKDPYPDEPSTTLTETAGAGGVTGEDCRGGESGAGSSLDGESVAVLC